MKTSLIRPGMLIGLKTAIRGGVTYQKVDLDPAHTVDGGGQVARWETTREIADAAEYERAVQTRGRVRNLIVRECCNTSFGLLCPNAREPDLIEAINAASVIVDAFNKEALHTMIDFRLIVGRVANDDEQAARAIGSEVRDLIATMEASIKAADPSAIRAAANTARTLAGMLSQSAEVKVNEAIDEARAAAREIVKRVQKAGEVAATVVDELTMTKLQEARFAVLDLADDDSEPVQDAPSAAPPPPSIDFAPIDEQGAGIASSPVVANVPPQLELE